MASTENSQVEGRVNRPACAACKHQRKKCTLGKCVLNDIFPASETEQFLAVHKVFGISNITKLMNELNSIEERTEAAKALKQQAMLWKIDPIRGASGVISRLSRELEMKMEENKLLSTRLHQLQGRHFLFPQYHHHQMVSSCDGFGITQQNNVNVSGSGNNVQVFQNNGVLPNNGGMRLENCVHVLMRDQEIIAPHGAEGHHQNFQNQETIASHEVEGQHKNFQSQEIGSNQDIRSPQEIEVQHQNFQNSEILVMQEFRTPQGMEVQHQFVQDQGVRARHGIERQHQHFLKLSPQ